MEAEAQGKKVAQQKVKKQVGAVLVGLVFGVLIILMEIHVFFVSKLEEL